MSRGGVGGVPSWLEEFATKAGASQMINIWRRYPDVTEAEDAATDRWACEQAARSFATFVSRRGVSAMVVKGEDPIGHPDVDYHYWTAFLVEGWHAVDWTVRQFHNLANAPETLPDAPLVWAPDVTHAHPVLGTFRRIELTGWPPTERPAYRGGPLSRKKIVTGECLCHGNVVTGEAGTVAQPEPYAHRDFWTGKTIRCWAVIDQGSSEGMAHDVPVASAQEVTGGRTKIGDA